MAEALGRDTTQVSDQSPFEGNLQAGDHGSDEENMNNVRHLLVERMDPDFGLLDKLLQLCALTYPENVQIRGEKSIFDRNDKLLEIIFNKMMHQALLTALTETGQKHLFNFVRGNGGYSPEFGTVWPLGERETHILDENRFNLVDIIDPFDLITRMYSKGIINNRQQMYINGQHNNAEKAEALLDVLRRGSEECYWKTVSCLQESNQNRVAEILKDGGALTQVHVSNEGEAEQVSEEKDQIIILEAVASLLQNRTLPQYQRIRDLRIIRATKGLSIVINIYCKNLEELLYQYALGDGRPVGETRRGDARKLTLAGVGRRAPLAEPEDSTVTSEPEHDVGRRMLLLKCRSQSEHAPGDGIPDAEESIAEKGRLIAEIAMKLRNLGIALGSEITPGTMTKSASTLSISMGIDGIQDLILNLTYEQFQDAVNRNMGNEPGVQQVTVMFRLAGAAVRHLGSAAAVNLKQIALDYFRNNVANWVTQNGGWEGIAQRL